MYPLLYYLMKEYADGGCNAHEQCFRLSLCRRQMVTECTFGKLKARFVALKGDGHKHGRSTKCSVVGADGGRIAHVKVMGVFEDVHKLTWFEGLGSMEVAWF